MAQEDDSEEQDGPAVPPLELAKSYLAFAKRSLKSHRKLASIFTLALLALAIVAVVIWPRTYTCSTTLAAMDSKVLDGATKIEEPLRGAEEIIRSHENVAAIVDEIKLTKRWDETVPPVSRLKNKVFALLRGEMSEKDKKEALVLMAQNAITVIPPAWGQSKLSINADWNDPTIAADLADAAEQSFLRARQVAEIASISEYIAILDGHANQLRTEIAQLAGQSQDARDEKLAQAKQAVTPAAPAAKPAPQARAAPAPRKAPTEDLSELRSELAAKQAAYKELEDGRQRRLVDAEATLTSLRSKFTDAHPMVVQAEDNVRSLSAPSPQALSLRSEVDALNATLKSKLAAEELAAQGGPRVASVPPSSGTPGASGVEPLPAELMRLMQDDNDELDPAVAAQFRTAVQKYATLRDRIGTAKLDLDTARAAFKHRYQIVIPPEAPAKPSKPKVPLILGVGLVLSLLAGLVAAVIAELRRDRVVERWQVYGLGVPLLGEMSWPPAGDS
ncbi:MAG TPA: hypothetical protein VHB79_03425 [Polyangiaceae bacterium]|nr:hypothetical protein [Polyangiaceae bacterium]